MRQERILFVLAVTALAVGSGCETTDRILNTAEQAVTSKTGREVLDIAQNKDIEEALRRRAEGYARDPEALLRDLHTVKRDFDTLMALLTGNVNRTWGKKEVKLPDRTKYVKYTQNYRSRTIVDFDAGEIVVETVQELGSESIYQAGHAERDRHGAGR